MKKKEEISDNECEFCNKIFKRESAILTHLCEKKRRWQEKDLQSNRIGFQTWLIFYKKNTATKKTKTYIDFIKSPYYLAFVKFGNYCVEAKVINVVRYSEWLVKNTINIDEWTSDKNYTRFLIEFLRNEDPLDALYRSIETTMDLAKEDNIKSNDILRYGNINKLCYLITMGKISPWLLYQSESGKQFLDKLDGTQVKMIIDYINPELWAIKFNKNLDYVKQTKELLALGGY